MAVMIPKNRMVLRGEKALRPSQSPLRLFLTNPSPIYQSLRAGAGVRLSFIGKECCFIEQGIHKLVLSPPSYVALCDHVWPYVITCGPV